MSAPKTNQHLNLQRTPESKAAKILNMSEEQLLQVTRNLDPEFMFTAVKKALHTFSDQIDKLDQNLDPAAQQQAVSMTLELLNSIADFSPDCRAQLGDLYQADAKEVLQDSEKLNRLKEVFSKLKHTESLQQMHLDLTNAMAQVAQQINQDQELYTQRLKDSIRHSPQMQEAIAEHEHLTSKSISSKRDNAPFDPRRILGHLWAILIIIGFIVPTEEPLYPQGFKHNDLEKDEFLDFNHKRFANSDVLPGAMPAPQGGSLPPGLKL